MAACFCRGDACVALGRASPAPTIMPRLAAFSIISCLISSMWGDSISPAQTYTRIGTIDTMPRKKPRRKKQHLGQPDSLRPSAQIMQAQQYMARKQWDQAAEILKQVVQRQPSHTEALTILGEVYANTQDIMNLWDVTEKLTRLESDEPTHWANLTTASLMNRRRICSSF